MKKKRKSKSKSFLRSKTWKSIRQSAIERDDHRCVLCGSQENLCVHHILYRHTHKDLQEDLDNLITICTSCHYGVHKDVYNFVLMDYLMKNRPDQWDYISKNLNEFIIKKNIPELKN